MSKITSVQICFKMSSPTACVTLLFANYCANSSRRGFINLGFKIAVALTW